MKRFILFITLCFLLILQSCKKVEEEPRYLKLSLGKEYHSLDPQKDILGKWETIAAGEYEDELRHETRFNWEFVSDRFKSFSMDFYSEGTFDIFADSLNIILDNTVSLNKSSNYYTFFEDGNTLKIASTNPAYNQRTVAIDKNGEVRVRTTLLLINNIIYFKRKK